MSYPMFASFNGIGTQGPQGPQGAQGEQGVQGEQGSFSGGGGFFMIHGETGGLTEYTNWSYGANKQVSGNLDVELAMPDCTLIYMLLNCEIAPTSSAQQGIVYIRKNGVNQSVFVTMPINSKSVVSTSTVSYALGDTFSLRTIAGNGAGGVCRCSCIFKTIGVQGEQGIQGIQGIPGILEIPTGATNIITNTALGTNTLTSSALTGEYNTAVGISALQYTTGSALNNTAIGGQALMLNTTGENNASVGVNSLYSNTTGSNNSAFGHYALHTLTTGRSNIGIGYCAGYTDTNSNPITTGNNNVFIGYNASASLTDCNYSTAIGSGALAKGHYQIVLGTASEHVVIGGAYPTKGASGTLYAKDISSTGLNLTDIFNADNNIAQIFQYNNNIFFQTNNSTTSGTYYFRNATLDPFVYSDFCTISQTGGIAIPYGDINARGYLCKAGVNATVTGNRFNFNWSNSKINAWIDDTYIGDVVLSDGNGSIKATSINFGQSITNKQLILYDNSNQYSNHSITIESGLNRYNANGDSSHVFSVGNSGTATSFTNICTINTTGLKMNNAKSITIENTVADTGFLIIKNNVDTTKYLNIFSYANSGDTFMDIWNNTLFFRYNYYEKMAIHSSGVNITGSLNTDAITATSINSGLVTIYPNLYIDSINGNFMRFYNTSTNTAGFGFYTSTSNEVCRFHSTGVNITGNKMFVGGSVTIENTGANNAFLKLTNTTYTTKYLDFYNYEPNGNSYMDLRNSELYIRYVDAENTYNNRIAVNSSGVTLTGANTITGDITVSGTLYFSSSANYIKNDAQMYIQTDDYMYIVAPTQLAITSASTTMSGSLNVNGDINARGYLCKAGVNDAVVTASRFNFNWSNSRINAWIDDQYIGDVVLSNTTNDLRAGDIYGRFIVFTEDLEMKSFVHYNAGAPAIDFTSYLGGFNFFSNYSDATYNLINFSTTGAITATSFSPSSDYRIKENVEPLDLTKYSIDRLNPVSYINKKTEKQDIGLIAHELQDEFPFLVTGEKDADEMQSVNYMSLISLLIKEVQDLKKQVRSNTVQIATLIDNIQKIEEIN